MSEPATWERTEDGGTRCPQHGTSWSGLEAFEIGRDQTAHGICPECVRNPKRPADVEVPDYWKPTRFGTPPREALACTYHGDIFELDEACRRCIDEDNDAEAPPHNLERRAP